MSLRRSIVPELLLDALGSNAYIINGVAESARGVLAFLTSPAYGVWSDARGRRLPIALAAGCKLSPLYALSRALTLIASRFLTSALIEL